MVSTIFHIFNPTWNDPMGWFNHHLPRPGLTERAMHWQLGWFVFFTKKRLETQSSDISSNLTQWFSNFGFADLAARWFRDGFWRFWQLWPNMTGLQRIWVQGMSSRQGCEKTRKPFEPTRHFGNYGIDKQGKLKKSMVNSSLKDPNL